MTNGIFTFSQESLHGQAFICVTTEGWMFCLKYVWLSLLVTEKKNRSPTSIGIAPRRAAAVFAGVTYICLHSELIPDKRGIFI